LQPDVAGRPATDRIHPVDGRTVLLEGADAGGEIEGDAFQHGAGQVRLPVLPAEADEHASGAGVPIR